MTGLSREKAAQVAARYFGTEARYVGGGYDTYTASDGQGRIWKFVRDSSIRCQMGTGRAMNSTYAVELVSPICQYADIAIIQELVRVLKQNSAVVNESCGIHIHLNAAPHTPKSLLNIVNIMAAKEDLLYKALQVADTRQEYCEKTNARFLEEVNRHKPTTLEQMKQIWYDGRDGSHNHYSPTRYRCLNLHSVFSKGTIEFRLFNSTLDPDRVKSYIQLCLAISHQALTQKSASYTRTQSTNEKYTFRTWLLRLGLIGEEFKTARKCLLEHLEGNIAWKDPAQAEAQRQRLAGGQSPPASIPSLRQPIQDQRQTPREPQVAVQLQPSPAMTRQPPVPRMQQRPDIAPPSPACQEQDDNVFTFTMSM